MQHQSFTHFQEIQADKPDMEALGKAYEALHTDFDAAQTPQERAAIIQRWSELQRQTDTWGALVYLRFYQDTTNEDYKTAREEADKLSPALKDLNVTLQKKMLASPHKDELQEAFGQHLFNLWDSSAKSFKPEIEPNLIKESKLDAEYTALKASAKIEFQGETWTLSKLRRFYSDPDRQVRRDAIKARWAWFDDNAEALDRIYDNLVKERHAMARSMGYKDFVELGYLRMQRVDYDRNDVDVFRKQVQEHLVPLVSKLKEKQAAKLGVDKLMWWDEDIHAPEGNPEPKGDIDWIAAQTHKVFGDMRPELTQFFEIMDGRHMMDLGARDGKAGGGFCTWFGTHGVPYIFANFNGNKDDIRVLIHELGHAFQAWSSRDIEVNDLVWPTFEACEIHSMGLEFLTYDQMEHYFGDDADRYRKIHLTDALMFIPYGVAVDHFQHLVFSQPEATPAQRHDMWKQMEALYLPWRDYGDLPHLGKGGLWQAQSHIYGMPFYYIDYTLAQTCALQYWAWSRKDKAAALDSYVKLCGRGGTEAFQSLATGAGLVSPFTPGCLGDVIHNARTALQV